MSIRITPTRATMFKSLGAVAIAGAAITGSLATSASAAPSGYTAMNRNIRGSISGPANCSNFLFTSVSSKFVPLGTHYNSPQLVTRSFTCTRGTTVVRGKLEMRGSFLMSGTPALPTPGRSYRLHMEVVKNGTTYSCGYTTATSLLVGRENAINSSFGTSWSQLLRQARISKSCGGSNVTIGIEFSEGWSAP